MTFEVGQFYWGHGGYLREIITISDRGIETLVVAHPNTWVKGTRMFRKRDIVERFVASGVWKLKNVWLDVSEGL